eukprot:12795682-Alexandrium_andersonii.AAC.1
MFIRSPTPYSRSAQLPAFAMYHHYAPRLSPTSGYTTTGSQSKLIQLRITRQSTLATTTLPIPPALCAGSTGRQR